MEQRVLAAVVASLVSQTLISFFLPQTKTDAKNVHLFPLFNDNSHSQFLPLLLHLLSASEISAANSLLSRKRRRRAYHDRDAFILPAPPNSGLDPFSLAFKMSSSTFEWLSGLLDPLLDCRDPAGSSLRLPGPTRLAIALYRLAAGAPYPEVARRFAVSEPAARFCTRHLCRVLCTNFRFWLAFPPSLRAVSDGFLSLPDGNGLPDCCGAIARARFEIGGGRAVTAQIVADSSSRILSIAAGFRGGRGVGEVLRSSSLCRDVQGGRLLGSGQYIVSGGGYPLLWWLMVPFANPDCGSAEMDFNAVQGLMCRPVHKAVSTLRDWGVTSRLMEEDGKMAVACIGTCAILHNVLLMRDDRYALSDASVEDLGNVERCGDKAGDCLGDKCAENEGFALRNTLAVKARAIRGSGQNPSVCCPAVLEISFVLLFCISTKEVRGDWSQGVLALIFLRQTTAVFFHYLWCMVFPKRVMISPG